LKYEDNTCSVGIKNVSICNWGNCRAQCILIRSFIDNDKRPIAKAITTAVKLHAEIDFYRLDNLEDFAKESTVARETIERWISAGILSPGETKIAERLIKIMREREHSQNNENRRPFSGS